MHARGQLDEALRIRKDEQLPVYEQLGDVRSKAIAQGKIADILHARGQLDEALELHLARLPVAEAMEDADSLAHIRFSCARIRLQQGKGQAETLEIAIKELRESFSIAQRLQHPGAIGPIGQLLGQVLADIGEKEAAQAVLTASREAYVLLGNEREVQAVDDLQKSLNPQILSDS